MPNMDVLQLRRSVFLQGVKYLPCQELQVGTHSSSYGVKLSTVSAL